MSKIFNKIGESLVKIFTFFWGLSIFKKILVFIFLFLVIPYFLSVILFYTRYKLPKDGFVPDENVIFTFREGNRIYKANYDTDGKLVKYIVKENVTQSGSSDSFFNHNLDISSSFNFSVWSSNYYDLFGLCKKKDFLFSIPCYGMFEKKLFVTSSTGDKKNEIILGNIQVFDLNKPGPYISLGTYSRNTNLVSVFVQKDNSPFFDSSRKDYIYIYNSTKDKWIKLLEAPSYYPKWYSDIELLKIED